MEIIYYTIAAIILYWVSDTILNNIEIRMGKRLPNRSFVFLIIITVLALLSFNVIRMLVDQPKPAQETTMPQVNETDNEPASSTPTQNIPATNKTVN